MTTVVARVCVDMLRRRRSRREKPLEERPPEAVAPGAWIHPEREAILGDSVGLALQVAVDELAPAERVAFVLQKIAPILDRSPAAARQPASRACRRLRDVTGWHQADLSRQWELVDVFRTAVREGDVEELVWILAPGAVRADAAAAALGAPPAFRDAREVVAFFRGRAPGAQLALVGLPGLVWAPGGRPRVALLFTLRGEKIASVDLVADPSRLQELAVRILD